MTSYGCMDQKLNSKYLLNDFFLREIAPLIFQNTGTAVQQPE